MAAAVLALASACGSPGVVDGVAFEDELTVRDDAPELRARPDGSALVVVAQDDGRTLRLVTVFLPAVDVEASELPLGAKQDGGAWLEVAQGALEETVRSDGVTVKNTSSPTFVAGTAGSLSLTRDGDVLYGTFRADLEDGGWVDGSFEVVVE